MGGGSSRTSAPGSSPMKKRGGCEIEARDVNYTICTSTTSSSYPYPFKIWSKEEEEEDRSKEVVESPDQEETSKRGSRKVLKNVSCRARPWEIMAIVGPSGAGKSTLLEILAGKLEPDATSAVLIDGKPMERSNFKKMSGYVTQKDTLFPLLTVYETLMFTAKLRLRLPAADLVARVETLLKELGLDHVAGARVGDERLRGISGGERRRVSIGVDVIHDPRVLILDEPTSGLDSTSALQIVAMLKAMAETRGRTVVLSIHQPGFRIVKLFNSVLLLADGSVLHHGTTEQLQTQMRSFGLNLPLHVNVVEFAIDAIRQLQQSQRRRQNSEPKDRDHERCTLKHLFQLSMVGEEQPKNVPRCCRGFANSRFYETLILAHRFSKNILRTKELFALRTLQMLAAGLLLGTIFYNLKDDEVGAQERVGLFAFILTFLLSCTTEALPIFLQEREILMKETSCGSYRVSSYVIANSIVFLPFLLVLALLFSAPLYWLVGLHPCLFPFMYFLLLIWLILYTANSVVVCFSALVPNFIVGNSIISGVMGSFFLFSGYFISKQGIPSYWMFMHYLSLFKYPFEGFLINEFSGKCLVYGNEMCVITGEDVLREEGFGEESRWKNVMIMVGFILLYRFFSYIILRCRCSQSMLKKLMLP